MSSKHVAFKLELASSYVGWVAGNEKIRVTFKEQIQS